MKRSLRLEVDGVALEVRVEGTSEARPVVILHGFTGSIESMERAAADLRASRPVVRIALLGHGGSDAPDAAAAYTMSRCVEQVRAVAEALRLERPHWLGYSMGGRVALSLAAAHPEWVASLVLVGVSAGLSNAEARRTRVASDEALAARIESMGVAAFVDDWMSMPLFASQKRLGEQKLARAREQRLACRSAGLAGSLRGMGTGAMPPLHDALASIERRVCLVVGDEDAKFRAIAAELERALPRARCEVIADAGHAAHLENPTAFAAVAASFFRDVDLEEAGTRAVDPEVTWRP